MVTPPKSKITNKIGAILSGAVAAPPEVVAECKKLGEKLGLITEATKTAELAARLADDPINWTMEAFLPMVPFVLKAWEDMDQPTKDAITAKIRGILDGTVPAGEGIKGHLEKNIRRWPQLGIKTEQELLDEADAKLDADPATWQMHELTQLSAFIEKKWDDLPDA